MRNSQRGRQPPVPRPAADFWRRPGLIDGNPLGSLIYFGTGLRSVSGHEAEAALIDPRLDIDPAVKDCRGAGQEWQPAYAACSPQLRAAYLLWLKSGRADPEAPAGHVLLYFYGLERRAVHEARTDSAARAELPLIRAEVQRLLTLYGRHRRFQEHADALVDFLAAQDLPPRSYLQEPVAREGDLTWQERATLGQCAQDRAVLPPAWAFRWVQPQLRSLLDGVPATWPEQFAAFFGRLYEERWGAGLMPLPSLPLRIDYRPASPSFSGTQKVIVSAAVPAVSAPRDLSLIVQEMARWLRANHGCAPRTVTSSAVIDSPDFTRSPPRGLLWRPLRDWPQESLQPLGAVLEAARRGEVAELRLTQLMAAVPDLDPLTLGRYQALCERLAGEGFGVVPDPRFGDSLSGVRGVLVFADDPATAAAGASAAYLAAALRMELSGAIARDARLTGVAHAVRLRTQLAEEAAGLTLSEQRRLAAHLQRVLAAPRTLSALKGRARSLRGAERERACDALVKTVRARPPDRRLTDKLLLTLIKGLRMLGVEAHLRHVRRLLEVPDGPVPEAALSLGYRIPPPPIRIADAAGSAPVTLDPDKVAALHQEQVRLAELLDPVFADSAVQEAVAGGMDGLPEGDPGPGGKILLGLDAAASAFLRVLLGQASWTRAELAALARGRGLPLDGVLERINEACYEQLDMPLFEDGDPLVLRPEAVAAIGAERGSS